MSRSRSKVNKDAVSAAGAMLATRSSVEEVLSAALPYLARDALEYASCALPVQGRDEQDAGECGAAVDIASLRCGDHVGLDATVAADFTMLRDELEESRVQIAWLVEQLGGTVRIPPMDEIELPEFFGAGVDDEGWLVLTSDPDNDPEQAG